MKKEETLSELIERRIRENQLRLAKASPEIRKAYLEMERKMVSYAPYCLLYPMESQVTELVVQLVEESHFGKRDAEIKREFSHPGVFDCGIDECVRREISNASQKYFYEPLGKFGTTTIEVKIDPYNYYHPHKWHAKFQPKRKYLIGEKNESL